MPLSRAANVLKRTSPGRLVAVLASLLLLSQLATAVLAYLPSVGLSPAVSFLVMSTPLPASAVLGVWVSTNLALALTAVVLGARALATPGALGLSVAHQAPPASAMTAIGVLCTLASVPLAWGLVRAEPVGLMLFLFTLAFLGLARGQDRLSGAVLAPLAVVSPQAALGPLAFLVAQRRWKAIWGLTLSLLVLSLIAICALAFDVMPANLWPRSEHAVLQGRGIGLLSWVLRWPGLDPLGAFAVAAGLAAGVLAFVGFAWRRPALGGRAFARAYLCFTSAGLLSALLTPYEDLVLLLPVAIAAIGLDRATVSRAVTGGLTMLGSIGRGRAGSRSPRAWIERDRLSVSRWPGLLLISIVLLALAPGLAWVATGPSALSEIQVWALLAGPALLMMLASSLPASLEDDAKGLITRRRAVARGTSSAGDAS